MPRVVSSDIRISTAPRIAPVMIVGGTTGYASFTLSRHIDAVASVTLQGHAGESTAGWQLGFLQVEWVETSWALYRGARASDGSAIVQRGRAPARSHQACMDNDHPGAPFYGQVKDATYAPAGEAHPLRDVVALPAHPAWPQSYKLYHFDKPADAYDLTHRNTRTGKINYLQAAQLEFMFCAVLVLRSPSGSYEYLKGFYWNTRWQGEFSTIHGMTVPLPLRAVPARLLARYSKVSRTIGALCRC